VRLEILAGAAISGPSDVPIASHVGSIAEALARLRNMLRFVRERRRSAQVPGAATPPWLCVQDALNSPHIHEGVASDAYQCAGIVMEGSQHGAGRLSAHIDNFSSMALNARTLEGASTLKFFKFEKHTLHVQHLSPDMTEDGIRSVFAPFGQLLQVTLRTKEGKIGWALVSYRRRESADALIAKKTVIIDGYDCPRRLTRRGPSVPSTKRLRLRHWLLWRVKSR